jgi:hypothetical protein
VGRLLISVLVKLFFEKLVDSTVETKRVPGHTLDAKSLVNEKTAWTLNKKLNFGSA